MILVVDDDRAVLRSLERILVADGYSVSCCSTAHGALASIGTRPPDAILLDLMMPAMNGREFLTALRDQLGRGDIPVIVITGVRGIDLDQAQSMGASDVIEKPFELDELLNKIALILFRRRKPQDALASALAATPAPAPALDARGSSPAIEIPAPQCAAAVLLLSADPGLVERVATLVEPRGRKLLALPRAMSQLPRLVSALGTSAVLVDSDLPAADDGRTLAPLAALAALRQHPDLARLPLLLIGRSPQALDPLADRLRDLAATPLPHPFDDKALLSWLHTPPLAPG